MADQDGRIVVSGVTKTYGAVRAVADLSFTVGPGQGGLLLPGYGVLFAALGWILTLSRDIP
jgi:hypothetical protein